MLQVLALVLSLILAPGTVWAQSASGPIPSNAAAIGITPTVTTTAATSLVIKAGPGNLYSTYAANLTSTAGVLMVFNATTAPADGTVTPLVCANLPANGFASVAFAPGPPAVFSVGITAVISTGTSCLTKTTGAANAFISGSAP